MSEIVIEADDAVPCAWVTNAMVNNPAIVVEIRVLLSIFLYEWQVLVTVSCFIAIRARTFLSTSPVDNAWLK